MARDQTEVEVLIRSGSSRRPVLHLHDLTATQFSIQLQRVANNRHGFLRPQQILDDDLLVLESLVVPEEPPQLDQQMRGQLRLVGDVR